MGVGRLGTLLTTKADFKAKGKAPEAPSDSVMSGHTPLLGFDATRGSSVAGSRRSYGTAGDLQNLGGPSIPKSHSPETYRSGNPLYNVPEETDDDDDDDDLEELLEEEGLYLGSYTRLVQTYTVVPLTSFLVWLLAAFVPPLIWSTDAPTTPPVPYFPPPLPELLLSISLFTLSHSLNPYLFALAGSLLPHPLSANVLGTTLHVLLRNALRLSAFPLLHLAAPNDDIALYRAPAFRRLWWFALGWSFAEVAVGIVQGYETLALYRDVLVPEGRARELVAAALSAGVRAQKNRAAATSLSPPRERMWESMSRAEDGVTVSEVIGSPVRPHSMTTNGMDIQVDEVDKDFDELVAVKAREELEELYGFPAIRVPVFVSCLLRIASILLSLGFVLLLSAGFLALPGLETNAMIEFVPPSRSQGTFWGTFVAVCGVNWGLSLLHTPVFLPRVGVHVVAYLGLLVGLGTLFAGLGVWDALA